MPRDEQTRITDDGEVAGLFYKAVVATGVDPAIAAALTMQYLIVRKVQREGGKEPWQP